MWVALARHVLAVSIAAMQSKHAFCDINSSIIIIRCENWIGKVSIVTTNSDTTVYLVCFIVAITFRKEGCSSIWRIVMLICSRTPLHTITNAGLTFVNFPNSSSLQENPIVVVTSSLYCSHFVQSWRLKGDHYQRPVFNIPFCTLKKMNSHCNSSLHIMSIFSTKQLTNNFIVNIICTVTTPFPEVFTMYCFYDPLLAWGGDSEINNYIHMAN